MTLRQSIRGYRDMVGMKVSVALLIDALFLVLGAYSVAYEGGGVAIVGWIAIAVGVFGVVEKIHRRVNA